MKKKICVLAALLLLLLSLVVLASCNKECEHTFGEWKTVTKDTCGRQGKQKRVCSECGAEETKTIKITKDHDWGDWELVTSPNCYIDGEEIRTCTVCGEEDTEITPRLGGEHVYNENDKICEICYEAMATVGLTYVYYDGETCGVTGIDAEKLAELEITDLTEIIVPATHDGRKVIAIEAGAFAGNTKIERLEISSNLQRIGEGAFDGCTVLEVVWLNNGAAESEAGFVIEAEAFAGCIALNDVDLPETLTELGVGAFLGCTALESIEIDAAAAIAIGDSAFAECTALATLILPENLTKIGAWAFYSCTALEELSIPASTTAIGESAFEFCINLKNVLVLAKETSAGSGVYVSNLSAIGSRAFYACRSLTNVDLSIDFTKLETIGTSAFENCSELADISLPETLKTVEAKAFRGCDKLATVHFYLAEDAEGYVWYVTNADDTTDTVKLEFNSTAYAARCLKDTYVNYIWTQK
ncbi:MAG: leucine-rich repeat domain-containing protein [Clostridia bacterium]|nr:leucine-rich repeat domain-containing protein [Clostridia bacterium]